MGEGTLLPIFLADAKPPGKPGGFVLLLEMEGMRGRCFLSS